MGFDVHGLNPKIRMGKPLILNLDYRDLKTDEDREKYWDANDEYHRINKGIYFQNNVWWWRPLWAYVCSTCADVMSEENMEAGFSNSSTEIPEEVTSKMARNLFIEIALGNHIRYNEEYKARLDSLPLESCDLCGGTGRRAEPPSTGPGDKDCNGCNATGERKPFETHYKFDPENLANFAQFLEDSGGIQIH